MLSCTPIQIIGGDATIRGDTAKLLGGYIPPSPPGFGTPARVRRLEVIALNQFSKKQ